MYKKILILCFGFSLLFSLETKKSFAFNKLSEKDQIEWCYGVYHGTKSALEIKQHDSLLQSVGLYDILKTNLFKKGQKQALSTPKSEKTKCYDLIYSFLATLKDNSEKLVQSKPYCFGYLEAARGESYIPVFCREKCSKITKENCADWCPQAMKKLKQERVQQGREDALKYASPLQFTQCVYELKSM